MQQPERAPSPHGRRSAPGAQGSPPSSEGFGVQQSQLSDYHCHSSAAGAACRTATGASWTDSRWPTARIRRSARSWWRRARPRARRSLAAPTLARPWRLSSTPCQARDAPILPGMHLLVTWGSLCELGGLKVISPKWAVLCREKWSHPYNHEARLKLPPCVSARLVLMR